VICSHLYPQIITPTGQTYLFQPQHQTMIVEIRQTLDPFTPPFYAPKRHF